MQRGGAHAVIADYEQAGGTPYRLTVVEYETPQLASDGERSLLAYYSGLPEDAKRGRITRRNGNYLVEATGVTDEGTALALIGSVDYAYRTWTGSRAAVWRFVRSERLQAAAQGSAQRL
jgi:hypothetical protein